MVVQKNQKLIYSEVERRKTLRPILGLSETRKNPIIYKRYFFEAGVRFDNSFFDN